MKKIIALVLVAMVAAGAFFYGRSYERENSEYEFFFTEEDKEALRASFLASGATAINEDVFELRWSEGGETYHSRCDLRVGLSERQIHDALVVMTELACYMDSTGHGRIVSSEFNNSESFCMP